MRVYTYKAQLPDDTWQTWRVPAAVNPWDLADLCGACTLWLKLRKDEGVRIVTDSGDQDTDGPGWARIGWVAQQGRAYVEWRSSIDALLHA